MRKAACLLALLVVTLSVAAPAQAEVYTNSEGHYHFTSPPGWTKNSLGGVDVVYQSPAGDGTNMNTLHQKTSGAKNEQAWLVTQATAGLAQINAQFSGTTIQAPRGFSAGGRAAADYIMEFTSSGVTLRMRQVMFGSEILGTVWILTFASQAGSFGSHASEFDDATDSFGVDNETSPFGLLTFIIIGAVVGGAVGGIIWAVRRKQARAGLLDQPTVPPLPYAQYPQPPGTAQPGYPQPPGRPQYPVPPQQPPQQWRPPPVSPPQRPPGSR